MNLLPPLPPLSLLLGDKLRSHAPWEEAEAAAKAPTTGSKGSSKVRTLVVAEDRRKRRKNSTPNSTETAEKTIFFQPLRPLSALTLPSMLSFSITNDDGKQTKNKKTNRRNPRSGGTRLQQRLSSLDLLLAASKPGHDPARRPPAPRRRGLGLQLLVDVVLLV